MIESFSLFPRVFFFFAQQRYEKEM